MVRWPPVQDGIRVECIDESSKADDVQLDEDARDAGIGEECEDIVLSLEDLKVATNTFSDENFWHHARGEKSYIGVIPNFLFVINVNFFDDKEDGKEDFQNEIKLLRLCRHPNVLRLLGERSWEGKNMLILERTPKGTLEDLLYSVPPPNISWESRLDIALDVATGLCYLHEDVGMLNRIHVVHRNLKPSTIFLTGHTAKIGGLALSRLQMNSVINLPRHRPIVIKGTLGYISPGNSPKLVTKCVAHCNMRV